MDSGCGYCVIFPLANVVGVAKGNSMLRSSDYRKLQDFIGHLQYSRDNMEIKQQIGEGCFGEVPLM